MTYLIVVVLILFSALFSGLTLGLMSLDVYSLERKMNLGDPYAKKVYPIRKRGNLLLTALLFGNVAVNAVLAIFLGTIATGVVAGIVATSLIFIFGEIIPQAVISRHALRFGAATAWIVKILLVVTYVITAPIAWALDRVLGNELRTVHSRRELMSIISEHGDTEASEIDSDEERILHGALMFSERTVSEVMTPRTVVEMIDLRTSLTSIEIARLRDTGHSRFPVYRDDIDRIEGILYIRDLVGIEDGLVVSDVYENEIHETLETELLDTVLNEFLKRKQHLFVVRNEFGAFEGVITIEDILEEILQTEIVDEDDKHVDMRLYARKKQT